MKKDSIGNRMKDNYENRQKQFLTRRTPVIMRLDGKAFHTLTRDLLKPFSIAFSYSMVIASERLMDEVQGAKCAYVQSDEVSILVTDFNKLTSEAWFDYNIQKMVSVAASKMTIEFNRIFNDADKRFPERIRTGLFDCRVFNLPKEEVCNYFVWRQQDCRRNSIQALAQKHFSHKQLHKKNQEDMKEMLIKAGHPWDELGENKKLGTLILPDAPVKCEAPKGVTPKYTSMDLIENRSVIEKLLIPEEE